MRYVWSDENRTAKYLDVEAALAKVQGELGLIPAEAAEEIISHCRLDQIDLPRLREQTERIGYPILGVVTQVNQLCRDDSASTCTGAPPPRTSPTPPPCCRSARPWTLSTAS